MTMKIIKRKEIIMSKIKKAYSNEALVEALKDRDTVYNSIKKEINEYNYDDEELEVFKKFDNLTQFQKDLLYLSSTMGVYSVADLYGVSATLLYHHLREIKKILHK